MKRIVLLVWTVVLPIFLMSSVQAQIFGGPQSMKGKVVVGADVGAGMYGDCFYVGIAPQAGYRLTRSLELGVRLGYELNHYNDYYYGSYNCQYFSGSAYTNLEIYRGLYLHAEDEELCMLIRGNAVNPNAPSWYNSVFVGVGYRQYSFDSSYIYYAFLYNLSWDYANSPYASPYVIRAGVCFAL